MRSRDAAGSPSIALADTVAPPASPLERAPAARPGLPVLPVLGGNRVLYIIAIGADTSARSKIVATLAERLQKYRLRRNPWIFAEPDWTVGEYIAQCQGQPPSTEGAVLLSIAATASGSSNTFFYSKNWFELDSDAAFITCDPSAMNCTPLRAEPRAEIGPHSPAPFCASPQTP
ncbi:MAG: hypothetical protein ABI346_10850 [Candidatus Baltobacteraceae bacterium]